MTVNGERLDLQKIPNREKYYSPDILPLLQTVLADLADIDVAYEKRLYAIKHSEADESRKSEMIACLWHQHRERRAPYVQKLMTLKSRVEATFT